MKTLIRPDEAPARTLPLPDLTRVIRPVTEGDIRSYFRASPPDAEAVLAELESACWLPNGDLYLNLRTSNQQYPGDPKPFARAFAAALAARGGGS